MRLTTRTNIAMRALMYCAVNPDRLVHKHDIAKATGASENHMAQVVHLLGKEGFLHTERGRRGGVRLARPADQVMVGTVFRQLEAQRPFTECAGSVEECACPLVGVCRLGGALAGAVEAFYAALDRVSLADLVGGNTGLARQLAAPA